MNIQEQLNAVGRMQEFIKNEMDEPVTNERLAEVSCFSPWYSYRLFKQYTGLTPADYVRKLRLSRSALKLRDESRRVADIAFELGFGSVDGYQRAFYREFGCNPHEYAARPVPLYLFTPYSVVSRAAKREFETLQNIKSVFIQVIEKPARKAVIMRGKKAADYFAYCEEVGCEVWGLLTSMKSLCGEPVCLWLPEKMRAPATSEYVQGVEVAADFSGGVPEGFDVLELPAAKYLMFQGEPFEEKNYAEAIECVRYAIKKYDPSFIGYEWDDENPRIQLEPVETRGYIELLAVRPAR